MSSPEYSDDDRRLARLYASVREVRFETGPNSDEDRARRTRRKRRGLIQRVRAAFGGRNRPPASRP